MQRDTLELRVFFKQGSPVLDTTYRENAANIVQFRDNLNTLLADTSVFVRSVIISSSASPEGRGASNAKLARNRAESLDRFLTNKMMMDPSLFRYDIIGEDWQGLGDRVEKLDFPWKDDALAIIRSVDKGRVDTDNHKQVLKGIDNGRAWKYMEEHIFPELRYSHGVVTCIISRPVRETVIDTVYIDRQELIRDTVIVNQGGKAKKQFSTENKKFLFALRTNFLAIPLANFGIEVPIGEHFSLGADYYYPWIWRPRHGEGVDHRGWCAELLALDIEARYWFKNKRKTPEQRLLGHSLGLYATAGYYDIEKDFLGHHGEFANVGIDYLYAAPICGGRMHMEFELGVGYIYSVAQPYDVFEVGGKAFRQRGVKKNISFFGPTRAMISLVVPIYSKNRQAAARSDKRKKGGDR